MAGGVNLWIVIPAYNEAARIGDTIAALGRQRDRDFRLIVVDNASEDDTASVARAAFVRDGIEGEVLFEPRRGIGAAVGAGFARAVDLGATHLLRTDADALPRPGWVAAARKAFDGGAEMLCGRVVPRLDEDPSFAERFVYPAAVRVSALAGRWVQRSRSGRRYKTRFRLTHGPSIGITVSLWRRLPPSAGGGLDVLAEDVEMLNEARLLTDAIRRVETMTVEASLRRLRAYGPRRLLLWHWDRKWVPDDESRVHVR